MSIDYYIINMMYHGNVYYSIWGGDDEEPFLKLDNKYTYIDLNHCMNLLYFQNIVVSDKIEVYDFDYILHWCDNADTILEYDKLIEIWNILSDISTAVKKPFCGDSQCKKINNIYNKLFYCVDMPAHHSSQEKLIQWTNEDIILIKHIIKHGERLLKIFVD